MKTYVASHFANRKILEHHILGDAPKKAKIVGTIAELAIHSLKHGQYVHGVIVEASDYVDRPIPVNTFNRGEVHVSKMNGAPTNLNKRKK